MHSPKEMLDAQKLTFSHCKAGARPEQLVGAVTLSIDWRKAFNEPFIIKWEAPLLQWLDVVGEKPFINLYN